MTQTTLEMLDASARDCEFDRQCSQRTAPRPERRRPQSFRKRRSAPFSANGRNNSRSTTWSMKRSQMALGG